MSLEAKIEALTVAVEALTKQFNAARTVYPSTPDVVPVHVEAPVTHVVMESPTVTAQSEVVTPAPAMPEPPAFAPVAPAAPVDGAPFNDTKGLIDYAMSAYKTLGPQKGAQIQSCLTNLGYQNINDVKPEHYSALYQAIETLKGA